MFLKSSVLNIRSGLDNPYKKIKHKFLSTWREGLVWVWR